MDPYKPAKNVKEALEKAVEKVTEMTMPASPGAPLIRQVGVVCVEFVGPP